MKDIFSFHVREVHITPDRKLRMSVCNINQVIHILEKIESSISELGPFCSEVNFDYAGDVERTFTDCPDFDKAVQSLRVSYVQKEKAHYKDVYIIHLLPTKREGTTVIFNESDLNHVRLRLANLISTFKRERARRTPIPTLTTTYPDGEARVDMFKTQAAIEHYILLDRMGSEAIHQQSQPGCEPKQRDIFNPGKKEE